MFTVMLNVPTGYVEDPDILTDVSFGRGYYGVESSVKQGFTISDRFLLSGEGGFGLNLPTSMEKRVPEETEAIIAQDRKTTVDLTPGQDLKFSGSAGIRFGFLTLSTKLGQQMHFRDTYSGSIEGNYDKLAETSEKSQTFIEMGGTISTLELFHQKKFMVPFIVNAKYHMPIAAKNSIDDRYFQISLVSFFKTPMSDMGKKSSRSGRLYTKNKMKNKKKYKKRMQRRRAMLGHH